MVRRGCRTFQVLKMVLSTALVLQLSDFDKVFMVDCDASGSRFGAVLHQGDGLVRRLPPED